MSERDELAKVIYDLTKEHVYFEEAELADEILAAGWRKPRVIASKEEVDSLPAGAVVLASYYPPDFSLRPRPKELAMIQIMRTKSKWIGDSFECAAGCTEWIELPTTVLHEGGAA